MTPIVAPREPKVEPAKVVESKSIFASFMPKPAAKKSAQKPVAKKSAPKPVAPKKVR